MKLILCFILSLIVATVTLAGTIRTRKNKCRTAMIGAVTALTLLFFPSGVGSNPVEVTINILASLFHAVRVLFLGEDYGMELFDFVGLPMWFESAYIVWLTLLYVTAPILTFGVILSFLGTVSEYIRISANFRNKIYLFSSSNERAICIAKGIGNKNSFFVFFSTDDKEIIDEGLKRFKYAVLPSKIGSARKDILAKQRSLTIYLTDADEDNNLSDALTLINRISSERPANMSKTDMFIFTESHSHELILNAMTKPNINLRRISESSALVNYIISSDKDISQAHRSCINNVPVSISLMGFGRFNEELFKCLIWYLQGRSDKTVLNLSIYTDDQTIAEITEKYPEIINTDNIKDAVSYSVSLKREYIPSDDSCSIMFIDYDNDSENITAAVKAYEQTAKIRSEGIIIKTPVRRLNIISAANNPDSMILRPRNHKNQIYPIEFIPYGIIHSLYKTAYRTAEKIAEKLFASWGGGNNTMYDFDFDYRSSMSSAFFWYMFAKECLDLNETEINPSVENMRLEHKRWNAFMRTEGYIYSPERNDSAKHHNCLDEWDNLPDKVKDYDGMTIKAVNKLTYEDKD